jgi:hypothetical protein
MTIEELEETPQQEPTAVGSFTMLPIQVVRDDETGLKITDPDYWRTVRPDAHLGAVEA